MTATKIPDPARSARARSSVSRGKGYERQFAEYLRGEGWSEAKRAVRTGYGVLGSQSHAHDPGDISGTPGLVWDVKQRADQLSYQAALQMSFAVETMRIGERAEYGFLVERVKGKGPAHWTVWLFVGDLSRLVTGKLINYPTLVRIRACDLVPLLHVNGYGVPLNPFEVS